MSKEIVYDVEWPGDPAAGIDGGYEQVTITIESGDPGGEVGEFESHMSEALAKWYDDGAKVRTVKPT